MAIFFGELPVACEGNGRLRKQRWLTGLMHLIR
jgi:hypothetical protein